MKALLPLLIGLLFTACIRTNPVQENPVEINIPDTPPPEFFEEAHTYKEIAPNVFSFEVLDETGNVVSTGYQVWGYDARQWYSQNIVLPQMNSLVSLGIQTKEAQARFDFLKLEQDLLHDWNPESFKPLTHLGCVPSDAYARASAVRPQTAAGIYGTAKSNASAKSCLYTATAIADASGGSRATNDFDNTQGAGQRAGASASQSGYCCFSARALADGPPAYKRVTAK